MAALEREAQLLRANQRQREKEMYPWEHRSGEKEGNRKKMKDPTETKDKQDMPPPNTIHKRKCTEEGAIELSK